MNIAVKVENTEQGQVESLSDSVKESFKKYIASLGDQEPSDIYRLFLEQMEVPLIEMMLKRNRGNESETARQLGIARGTLRTLRKKYNITRKAKEATVQN